MLHHGDGNWNFFQRVFLQGPRGLSDALFLVNIFAYISLNLCTLVRIFLFPRKVWADLVDPQRVFSFFTIIAGSDVLGMGLDLRDFGVGTAMFWAFALFLWLALIYCGFGVLIFLSTSRDVDIAHGGWLIAIVATQSLAILGAAVAMNFPAIGPGAFILTYMLWGLGLILYSIFIVQFTGRVFFFEMAPSDVTPVLWVVMGAAAIGANAGSELVRASVNLPLLLADTAFRGGGNADHLGLGDVVGASPPGFRHLEARDPPCACALHTLVLEPRVPHRNVRGSDPAVVACVGFSTTAISLRVSALVCACGLDSDSRGFPQCGQTAVQGRSDTPRTNRSRSRWPR